MMIHYSTYSVMEPGDVIRNFDGKVIFTFNELKCKSSSKAIFCPSFLENLRLLRINLNKPMKVNSCCRSKTYNIRIGGSSRSYHIYNAKRQHTISGRRLQGTLAIDIAIPDDRYRYELVELALGHCWCVGIYKNFVHLDCRTKLLRRDPVLFWGSY